MILPINHPIRNHLHLHSLHNHHLRTYHHHRRNLYLFLLFFLFWVGFIWVHCLLKIKLDLVLKCFGLAFFYLKFGFAKRQILYLSKFNSIFVKFQEPIAWLDCPESEFIKYSDGNFQALSKKTIQYFVTYSTPISNFQLIKLSSKTYLKS